ncbi:MAG TPA: RusA family crossover junction endodeoxyribonuclease [Pseudolabrys sp.]|nr:RusA family crossover junction endodeoxyribonuclease [Pseudolabrys sp.]
MTVLAMTNTNRRAGRLGQEEGSVEMAGPTTFTMPIPPSVNQMFRNVRGKGRVKTGHYEAWSAAAATSMRLQQVQPVTGPVLVIFGVERHSLAADIDNRIKAMLDAIVKAKIIRDDSDVTAFAAAWLPSANGLAHVQIFPTTELGIVFHPSRDRVTGGWFVSTQPSQGDACNGTFDQ